MLTPGYIAWVADDGEEVHVGVGGYASRFRPAEAIRRFQGGVAPRSGLEGAAACERRGGHIPVGGMLPRTACARGLLTGDAAGAVSPLTAGGLDPCLRLSALAADFLGSGDEGALAPYGGAAFRTRFRTRLLLRRLLGAVLSPAAAELACATLRLPPFRRAAAHVFFGRESFPDAAASPGQVTMGSSMAPE